LANRFNALDLASGKHRDGSPSAPVAGQRTFPDSDFPNNASVFRAIKQLQRPGMAITAISVLKSPGMQAWLECLCPGLNASVWMSTP
jgi:hypothetical protein